MAQPALPLPPLPERLTPTIEGEVARLEQAVVAMEELPFVREPDPQAACQLVALAKVLRASAEYLATVAGAEYQPHLDDLHERADELIDTHAWGLDGGQMIRELSRV